MSPTDLALALLLIPPTVYRSEEEWEPIDERPGSSLTPTQPEAPEASPNLQLARKLGAEILDVLTRNSERSVWALRHFPALQLLAASDWAPWILPAWEDIQRVYGDANPFLVVDAYSRQFLRSDDAPSPWHPYRNGAHPTSVSHVQETVSGLARRLTPTCGSAFTDLVEAYVGRRPIAALLRLNLPSLLHALAVGQVRWDPTAEQGWTCDERIEDPEQKLIIAIVADIAAAYAEEWEGGEADESVLRQTVTFLTKAARSLTAEYVEVVTDVQAYLASAQSHGAPAELLPRWDDILSNLGCHRGWWDSLLLEFLDAIISFESTGYAPDGIIPMSCLGLETPSLTECPKSWHIPVKLSEIFAHADWYAWVLDVSGGWEGVRDLLDMLLERSQYHVADAFLGAYLYLRVVVIRKAVPELGELLCRIYKIPADARSFTDRTLAIIRGVYTDVSTVRSPAKGLVRALAGSVGLPTTSVVQLPGREMLTDDELEGHLIEMLSQRVWDALSEPARADLQQAERRWESLRTQRRRQQEEAPERAFFQHLACAVEVELKRCLDPLLTSLQECFARSPVSNDDAKRWLQETVKPKNQTLGTLVNLVAERKERKKLKGFPDLLGALNRSQLVRRVFDDDEKRRALRDVAEVYRNPASHPSEKNMGYAEAAALRQIVYGKSILRDIVEARIDDPIQV